MCRFLNNYSRARSSRRKKIIVIFPSTTWRLGVRAASTCGIRAQDKFIKLARNILSSSTIFWFVQRIVKTKRIITSDYYIASKGRYDYIVLCGRKPDARFNDYLLARPPTAHLNERINFRTCSRAFLIWTRVDVVRDTFCRPLPFPLRSLSRQRLGWTPTCVNQSANCSPALKLCAGQKWRFRHSRLCCDHRAPMLNFQNGKRKLPCLPSLLGNVILLLERRIINRTRHAPLIN